MIKFFAMIARMKYINRWSLMRNEHSENLCENSFDVASTAHALAVIGNRRFGKNYNAERCALLGLYHDAPETLTGDLPTPVKYYSEQVRAAYNTVEEYAAESLISMLPDDIKEDYVPLLKKQADDKELWKIVKAADKISALVKCVEEVKSGSAEFRTAAESTREAIRGMNMPEADFFLSEVLPAYELTLDELKNR